MWKTTFCFILLLLLFLNWANSAITKQTDNVCVSVFRVDFRKRKWTKQTLQFTAALLCHKVQIGERLRRSITTEAHKHNSLDQQTAPAEKSSRQQKSTIKRKNKKPATGNEILIFTIYFPVVSFSAPFHQHTIWLILANRMTTASAHLVAVCCCELSLRFDCCCILLQNIECRIQLYLECCYCWRETLSVYITIQTQFKYGCNSSTLFSPLNTFFAFFPFTAKKLALVAHCWLQRFFFSTAKPKEWVNEQGKKKEMKCLLPAPCCSCRC